MTRFKLITLSAALIATATVVGVSQLPTAQAQTDTQPDTRATAAITQAMIAIDESTFDCITDMTPVRGFFVDNLLGDLDATLAVANSETGGTWPAGSLVQLVPTEVMVKQPAGTSPATNDWEFFELEVSAEGSSIVTRGFTDVINRFGGNCLDCHKQAEPQWDMICESDHGCAPIPLSREMLVGIQQSDPRCKRPEGS